MSSKLQYNQVHKITENHLKRKAVVYVRQSSAIQVKKNIESQHLQYGLKKSARSLGFKKVKIIDEDLGISAGGKQERPGFTKLISQIALQEVGMVFAFDATRLSRNDKDWCQLVEVCRLFDTLIGDGIHVYDLNEPDDQLILGIKGTISVRELTTLQLRCRLGIEAKAKRGELKKLLPPGYIHNNEDKIMKDPNIRIQQAIEMIFDKFKDLGSIRQVHKWFHEENIQLPVNQMGLGRREINWKLPSKSFIKDVLHNPVYAGCYAYGKRKTKTVYENGRIIRKQTNTLPMEEWTVLLKEHHEKYLTWDEYECNLSRIQQNTLKYNKDMSMGPVKNGLGLLTGLLRCGECGRKIYTRSSGKSKAVTYRCHGEYNSGGRYCIGFGSSGVDKKVGNELLEILNPLTLKASLEAVSRIKEINQEKITAVEYQLSQVEYETRRAFEQYNSVDSRNRLVAYELEKNWNKKLEELEQIKNELCGLRSEVRKLDKSEEAQIMKIGDEFKKVWNKPSVGIKLKKEIIRTIINEIIVNTMDNNKLQFIVNWKGGIHTEFEIERMPSPAVQKNPIEAIEIIRKMTPGYTDAEMACVLNQSGLRTGKGNRWSKNRVKITRCRAGILRDNSRVNNEEILSLTASAKYCKVSHSVIEKLAHKGILKYNQIVPLAPWKIKKTDLDSESVRSIIKHLKKTGTLIITGGCVTDQMELFK